MIASDQASQNLKVRFLGLRYCISTLYVILPSVLLFPAMFKNLAISRARVLK